MKKLIKYENICIQLAESYEYMSKAKIGALAIEQWRVNVLALWDTDIKDLQQAINIGLRILAKK